MLPRTWERLLCVLWTSLVPRPKKSLPGDEANYGHFMATNKGADWSPSPCSGDGGGIRRGNEMVYVGEASPDPLVIDYNIIRTAPVAMN